MTLTWNKFLPVLDELFSLGNDIGVSRCLAKGIDGHADPGFCQYLKFTVDYGVSDCRGKEIKSMWTHC